MHFFMLDKDNPTELVLRHAWFPHWMVHSPGLIQAIYNKARTALPTDLSPEMLSESHYDDLDQVVIEAAKEQLPHIVNIDTLLEAVLEIEFDHSKAAAVMIKPRPPSVR